MSSRAKLSRSLPRSTATGHDEQRKRKPKRRHRHASTDQLEEYLSLIFKVAKIQRDPGRKVTESELQHASSTAVQNLKLLTEQSVVDTFVCCSKLGRIDDDVTNALRVEIQRSLATLRGLGNVNPLYHSRVIQAAYTAYDAQSIKELGIRVYQYFMRSAQASLRSLHSTLYDNIKWIRDVLPKSIPAVVHAPDSTTIQEMRKRASRYQKHRSGGRVAHQRTSEGPKIRPAASHMPWLFEPTVKMLDVLLVQLSAPPINQVGDTSNPIGSATNNIPNSDRFGFQRSFAEEQLLSMLKSLSTARYFESTLMDLIILHLLAQVNMTVLTMHSLVEALYACSRMAHHNRDLVDHILSVLNHKDGWKLITSPDHACMVLWSLCVLERATPELLERGAARMRQLGKRGGKFSSIQRRQLAQVQGQPEAHSLAL